MSPVRVYRLGLGITLAMALLLIPPSVARAQDAPPEVAPSFTVAPDAAPAAKGSPGLEPSTQPRGMLGGHEAGNGGYGQAWTCAPPRLASPQRIRTHGRKGRIRSPGSQEHRA